MCESPTYRNITYRLLPGDVATANKLLGTWDACRYAWNEVKEARELQYGPVHELSNRILSNS